MTNDQIFKLIQLDARSKASKEFINVYELKISPLFFKYVIENPKNSCEISKFGMLTVNGKPITNRLWAFFLGFSTYWTKTTIRKNYYESEVYVEDKLCSIRYDQVTICSDSTISMYPSITSDIMCPA